MEFNELPSAASRPDVGLLSFLFLHVFFVSVLVCESRHLFVYCFGISCRSLSKLNDDDDVS